MVMIWKKSIIVFLILLMATSPAFAMSPVKDWINKIRPGTFETDDSAEEAKDSNQQQTFSESQLKLLTSLKKREEQLKQKDEAFQKRASELKSLSQQIEQKLDQMRKMTSEFEKKRRSRQEMDQKDISRMVKYYETMDPERTAVFFNQMDRLTAMHILMRMNPRKASAVMELIEPKVAVEITEKISGFKEGLKELQQ